MKKVQITFLVVPGASLSTCGHHMFACKRTHIGMCSAFTWRMSCSVSPMKGKPMDPGGSGLGQLGSLPRIM